MEAIGKYEVIAEIGSGSMGAIYQARDTMLDRAVALKVLRAGADLDMKERFYREARACARLSHPNIVAVYDLGESGDTLFIAMELLSGSDLRKLLKENRLPGLPVKLEVMAQVCDALAYAHSQQVVHRDIKSSNIFLCDDLRAKVLEFGTAKFPTSNLTVAGKVLGSPNYMAPEQIRTGKCDGRSDLFSAAIVFHEFLVGTHPFQDEFIPRRIVSDPPDTLRSKRPDLPAALEALLLHALEKDPDKRIRTAAEFAAGLRSALSAIPPTQSAPVTIPVQSSVAAEPAPIKPPTAPQTIPPPTSDDTAERRVSEFLRVVGDFDEGIEKRDTEAARVALQRMRQLVAIDNRFVVAVSDCEMRLNEITPAQGVRAATVSTSMGSRPREIQPSLPPTASQPVTLPPPPPAVAAKKEPAKSNKGRIFAAVAILFVLSAVGVLVKVRRNAAAEKPAPAAPPAPAAALATAVVVPPTADLIADPNKPRARVAVLHHGEMLSVIALPAARDQPFTNVRTADNPLTGFVRTAELSEWAGANAEAAFALDKLFATAETGGESELNAQLEQWNQFIGRFPTSPHMAEVNLEAARIEFALARLGKSANRPATEWQPHLDRAQQTLASVTIPDLRDRVAELRRQIADSRAAAHSSTSLDNNMRAKISSLWESGQYQDAMALVDRALASAPNNQEARMWKTKIHASQEAEANAK
jgi:serine/threonine protein kinase